MFQNNILSRGKFKKWIRNIIDFVLSRQERFPFGYDIDYTPCCVAHNIYVKETREPFRKIAIDFVPAIVMGEALFERCDFQADYLETFLAIPKPLGGHGCKSSKYFQFQLVNPVAERDIIWDKQNLKVVYRLLKSLRNNYNLPRLKSYFLTTVFLYEVAENDNEFWHESIGDIFLHVSKEL